MRFPSSSDGISRALGVLVPASERQQRTLPALDEDGLLMGEVRHATGNLLHRMRYWTSLLEGEALGGPAAEAVTELRSSLDGLQQLIAGTMELLKPSTVRSVSMPAADVARAVALRFGVDAEPALKKAQLRGDGPALQVDVDPALLDRALTVLSEVFEGIPGDSPITIDRCEVDGAAAISLAMTTARRSLTAADPYGPVHHDVNIALASKLLGETGCECSVETGEGPVRLAIRLRLQASEDGAF